MAVTIIAALPASAGAVAKSEASTANVGLLQRRQFSPEDNFTAVWTRDQALRIRQDATNTSPRIPADFPIMTDRVWIWDTWPLTNLSMRTVTVKGWKVIFSLTAPRNIFFGDRHWVSRIGYFYSRDGRSWVFGGDLFPDGASRGAREWAGSTLLVGNTVYAFYTASGHDGGGADPTDTLQRLATATGRIEADHTGVRFTGFRDHRIILEPDGTLYQTQAQSQAGPIIYAFRDPFVFRDRADGRTYMLFEGNSGGTAGTHTCGPREIGDVPPGHVVPPDSRFYTGNIGLATTDDLAHWRLLPPLLSANCVNQQTERPHLVIRGGSYYLFTISHMFTFAPGLTGPDGLYGFVGPSLRSDYGPLNGSALAIGNPPDAPLQQYSHFIMQNGLVESFIDTVPTPGGGVRFGGTLAPTLVLALLQERTRLVAELDYGFIP